jgi:8-oxo-dGTP pyrophosphatase MutT (NUDIX family)
MSVTHDSETPAHAQQIITACAFIHHNFNGVEKLFSAKRAATKKFLPDIWEIPGGHIDFSEDIVEGLKREVKEELGMTISVGDPFVAFTYMNEVKGSHSVQVIYFARFNEPIDQVKLDPEDHSTCGWFAENEIDKLISKNKPADDVEILAFKKGFELLRGESLRFG